MSFCESDPLDCRLRRDDWSKILGWPGYTVYQHEKRGNRKLICSGYGVRIATPAEVTERPRFDQVNLALAKAFAFSERTKLQFRAEFFNLLNHPQLGTANLNLFNDNGTYAGSAGAIQQTAGVAG